MPDVMINLVTIRSSDIDRAVRFYEAIGLRFQKHAHGKGPQHYCSEDAGLVFEIYPLDGKHSPTTSTRLGFSVDSLDALVEKLTKQGAELLVPPAESLWGRRAVVADFDGHRIELTAKKAA